VEVTHPHHQWKRAWKGFAKLFVSLFLTVNPIGTLVTFCFPIGTLVNLAPGGAADHAGGVGEAGIVLISLSVLSIQIRLSCLQVCLPVSLSAWAPKDRCSNSAPFPACITDTKRLAWFYLACRIGKFGPYLADMHSILISVGDGFRYASLPYSSGCPLMQELHQIMQEELGAGDIPEEWGGTNRTKLYDNEFEKQLFSFVEGLNSVRAGKAV
jgi:hypothetical protein